MCTKMYRYPFLLQMCSVRLSFYLSPTDGQLRHVRTGEPFVFNAREDLHRWNQKRYEALGEVTRLGFLKLRSGQHVQHLLPPLPGLLGFSNLTLQDVAVVAVSLESKQMLHFIPYHT